MCVSFRANTDTTTVTHLMNNKYIRYFAVRNYLVPITYNTPNGSTRRDYTNTSMLYYSRFPHDNHLRSNTISGSCNLTHFFVLCIIWRYTWNGAYLNLNRVQIGTPTASTPRRAFTEQKINVMFLHRWTVDSATGPVKCRSERDSDKN
jgi:hypothetical protein